MPTVRSATRVDAPAPRTFDLARSVDLQRETLPFAGRPIAGRTAGLGDPGERTVWRPATLGARFDCTTKVTVYSRPHHFRWVQVEGPFAHLVHDYFFGVGDRSSADGTTVREVLTYDLPGPVGGFLAGALRGRADGALATRTARLRAVAESDEWRRYL
jgi:hypothetical protein